MRRRHRRDGSRTRCSRRCRRQRTASVWDMRHLRSQLDRRGSLRRASRCRCARPSTLPHRWSGALRSTHPHQSPDQRRTRTPDRTSRRSRGDTPACAAGGDGRVVRARLLAQERDVVGGPGERAVKATGSKRARRQRQLQRGVHARPPALGHMQEALRVPPAIPEAWLICALVSPHELARKSKPHSGARSRFVRWGHWGCELWDMSLGRPPYAPNARRGARGPAPRRQLHPTRARTPPMPTHQRADIQPPRGCAAGRRRLLRPLQRPASPARAAPLRAHARARRREGQP